MAQLVTAYPKLFSKSPDQELSESVVKVSGNSKFTRLDVREQCHHHNDNPRFDLNAKVQTLKLYSSSSSNAMNDD